MDEAAYMDSERLARYVSGEADATERLAVEQWAAASPANARELEAFSSVWAMADTDAQGPEVDVARAWNALEARIQDEGQQGGRVISLQTKRTPWRWAAAAAAVVGLVLTYTLFLRPATQEFASVHEHVRSVLTDSSTVTLSPGSSVAARMGDERRVQLKGEAYFQVRRDEAHPFVVDAGEVQVTVLGTSFEVSAYDTSGTVLVRVREGRVQVASGVDTVVLVAGEHARYDKQRHMLERVPAPPSEVYGERVIQFERATMLQVTEQLQRIFHVRIELQRPGMERCMLTAGFEDESIEAILRVIADTFGMRVEHPTDSLYTLDGDGC